MNPSTRKKQAKKESGEEETPERYFVVQTSARGEESLWLR